MRVLVGNEQAAYYVGLCLSPRRRHELLAANVDSLSESHVQRSLETEMERQGHLRFSSAQLWA